jgi:transcriptional regulator with XRE-family HTH domain
MTTRERATDRGRRRGERILEDLARELRDARGARNLSQAAVGRAVGLSASRVSLIERGMHREVPLIVLAQLLEVVGRELSARAHPGGSPLRDAGQLRLLARFRERLSPSFNCRTEVPIPGDGDLRAWDLMLENGPLAIGVDAETRLRDVQAVDRRVMLKLRDSRMSRAIILVAATHGNRLALRASGAALAANYPVSSGAALRALANGRDPGGSSIIIL